jgi:hypothetical protein
MTMAKKYDRVKKEEKDTVNLAEERVILAEKRAILVAAYYLRSPWSDAELVSRAKEFGGGGQPLRDIVAALSPKEANASQRRRASGRKRRQRR